MASTKSDQNGSSERSTENTKPDSGGYASEREGKALHDKKENDPMENTRDSGIVQEMEGTQSKPGLQYIRNPVGLLACVIVCLIAIVAIFISPPERVTKGDFDLVEDFGNGVDQLRLSFTNQTERFWKILKNRGSAHLRDNNPSQPLVFLLAAPPPAHAWVDCLATKLAEMLELKQKRNLAKINGTEAEGYPGDEFKEKMDVYLKEKFEDDHRVAVIFHLELLLPPSPMLFYSYCEDQDVPYKHVTIIVTVHLTFKPSLFLSPQETEEVLTNTF